MLSPPEVQNDPGTTKEIERLQRKLKQQQTFLDQREKEQKKAMIEQEIKRDTRWEGNQSMNDLKVLRNLVKEFQDTQVRMQADIKSEKDKDAIFEQLRDMDPE